MNRDELWRCIFISSLGGAAPYVKNKADCDELIARAKMLADQAAPVALTRRSDLPVDEEPFPLVRELPTDRASESRLRVTLELDEVGG